MSKTVEQMLNRLNATAQDMPPAAWPALAARYERMGWTFHADSEAPTLFAHHYDLRRHGFQRHRFSFLPGTSIANQVRIIRSFTSKFRRYQ